MKIQHLRKSIFSPGMLLKQLFLGLLMIVFGLGLLLTRSTASAQIPERPTPTITGSIKVVPARVQPGQILRGTIELTSKNLPSSQSYQIYLELVRDDGQAMLRKHLGLPLDHVRSPWRKVILQRDGVQVLRIEEVLKIKAGTEEGANYIFLFLVDAHGIDSRLSECQIEVASDPLVKEIRVMDTPSAEPAGPYREGAVFKFNLRYRVTGLPRPPAGQTVPPEIKVTEKLEVLKRGKPLGNQEFWNTQKSARFDRNFSSSTGQMGRRAKFTVHDYPAGSYKIKYLIESPGFIPAEGEFPFEILPATTPPQQPNTQGAVPQDQGTSWGLKEVRVDPGKISSYDPAWKSVTASAATCIFERGGVARQLNVNVSGTPPSYLQPGSRFDISITVSASPMVQEGYLHSVGAGVVGTDIIKIEHDPPGPDDRVFAGWKGLRPDEWIPSATMTYHCSVPSQIDFNSWPDEISLSPFIGGTGLMATYVYKQGEKPKNDQGEDISGKAGIDDAPETLANLSARFQTETIELIPGEVSKQDGIFVKGWRSNTSDRVEVQIDTVDGFGSLAWNPDIIVDPGPTSDDPGNMSHTGVSDKKEYFFPEKWSARSTARPGTTQVPIVIRQAGLAPVNLVLNVRIVPRPGASVPGGVAGPPITQGTSADGLSARLQLPALELVPGEVSKSCNVFVRGWQSGTQERVEVLFPQSDGGSLPGGLVVTPGGTSETPANMIQAGVSDNKEYSFQEMFRARRDAPPGDTTIDIIVSQAGRGQVPLRLLVRVLPTPGASAPPTGATGTPIGEGASPLGLRARLQVPALELFPGEVSKSCDVFVQGWQSDGGRVEVLFPQGAEGALPGGIVVFPGSTSEDPANMSNPGVADAREYPFQQMFRAREGAPAGISMIDVIVRQPGRGDVSLRLQVAVRARTGETPGPPQPKPGRVILVDRATVPRGALSARLQSASLDLVPGEVSTPCNIFVSGWRGNTRDRVEAVFPEGRFGGELPGGIVVFPGNSSEDPGNMINPGVTGAVEYAFQQMFRARENAPPGQQTVDILIRQKEAGELTLRLLVRVREKRAAARRIVEEPKVTTGVEPPKPPPPATTKEDRQQATALAKQAQQLSNKSETRDQGIKLYRQAIQLDPNNPEHHFNLAQALQGQGKWPEVEKELREAVRLMPHYANYHESLANACFNQQKWDEAEKEFLEALRLDPKNFDCHRTLAAVYSQQNRWNDAVAQYRTWLEVTPGDGYAHADLANALLRLGKKDEALTEAKEAQRLGVKYHPVFGELGLKK